MKKIGIIQNGSADSRKLAPLLAHKLRSAGFEPLLDSVAGTELVVCIGGDGSFLHTLRRYDFPDVPFAGFNTGHLGFFQELGEEDIDFFVEKYTCGDYTSQPYRTVEAVITHKGGSLFVRGLNEIVVRGDGARLCHLRIMIGDSFIENFSGDGVVVSTPAGSTAYNYALGGSIVDPRLSVLQLSPIAPVNSAAYRSFTSGILLPPDLGVGLYPVADMRNRDRETLVSVDGEALSLTGIQSVSAILSEKAVTLLRFKDYSFWNTVKEKLL